MKILALTPLFLPIVGGIEIIVGDLASALRARSIDTVVVTDTAGRLPRFEVLNETRIYRFDFARSLRSNSPSEPLSVMKEMSDVLEAERPDCLHLHSATQASAFFLDRLLRKLKDRPPLIITQHGVLEPVDQLGLVRDLLLRADVITAVSDAVLRSALLFSGRAGGSERIYNGISLQGISSEVRVMPPRHMLLCAGRMQIEKGFDLAIEALAKVREAGLDVELWLIGHGEDRGLFETLASDLRVTEHVRFLGPLDRETTRQTMMSSSLLLAPSRTREGFCLVAAEAASVGTPCIASNVGGLAETVENGISGCIVPAGDVQALSGAIISLLNNQAEWQRMSANARRLAAEKFNFERCVDSYSAIYKKLLSQRGRYAIPN